MSKQKKEKKRNMIIRMLTQNILKHVGEHYENEKGDKINYNHWYVGITGQDDLDGDGKSDRYVEHKATFPMHEELTWKEFDIAGSDNDERKAIAMTIEINMEQHGFDVGDKIQSGTLPIKKVYTFRKGTEDLRDKKD